MRKLALLVGLFLILSTYASLQAENKLIKINNGQISFQGLLDYFQPYYNGNLYSHDKLNTLLNYKDLSFDEIRDKALKEHGLHSISLNIIGAMGKQLRSPDKEPEDMVRYFSVDSDGHTFWSKRWKKTYQLLPAYSTIGEFSQKASQRPYYEQDLLLLALDATRADLLVALGLYILQKKITPPPVEIIITPETKVIKVNRMTLGGINVSDQIDALASMQIKQFGEIEENPTKAQIELAKKYLQAYKNFLGFYFFENGSLNSARSYVASHTKELNITITEFNSLKLSISSLIQSYLDQTLVFRKNGLGILINHYKNHPDFKEIADEFYKLHEESTILFVNMSGAVAHKLNSQDKQEKE